MASAVNGFGVSTTSIASGVSGKTCWNSRVAATSGFDATTMRSMALSSGIRRAKINAPGMRHA